MNEDNFPGLQGGTGGQQGGARDQHPDQEQRDREQGHGVHVWMVDNTQQVGTAVCEETCPSKSENNL